MIRISIVIAMVAALFYSATAHAQSDVDAYIDSQKAEITSKLGVSDKAAESYLRTALSAVRARETANKDKGNNVLSLYADTLEKYAQVVLFGEVVVVRGTTLFNEIKDGVPGTPVPQPLVKKINAWASFAGEVIVMSADAGKTAGNWATQRAVQSGYCDTKSPKLNFKSCEKILKETLDMVDKIMSHMEAASKAIRVMVLTVPRMTY